jgi:hypothetical protein
MRMLARSLRGLADHDAPSPFSETQSMKISMRFLTVALAACLGMVPTLAAAQGTQRIRVDITNNAPLGGVALTPVWIGIHSGSFDSYNGGLSSQPGLERLAEDGDTALLSAQFADFDATSGGYTYVDPTGPSDALVRTGDLRDQYRLQATIGTPTGPPPLLPGESVSHEFEIRTDGSNAYVSYLSMVLPTNDLFVANGNPLAHSLSSLYDGVGSISFNIGGFNGSPVNDAGTEAESYVTSAGNGLFGLAGGQSGPNQGAADPNNLIRNVTGTLPLDSLNFIEGSQPLFDFNNGSLYGSGIATITITAIPEPTSVVSLLLGLTVAAAGTSRRRRG